MKIAWSQTLSFSKYRDLASGLCLGTDRLYIVGSDEHGGPGKMRYRCISMKMTDGTVISEWTDGKTNPFAVLLSCVTLGEAIYALGATNEYWSILVFNKNLELLKRVDIKDPRIIPFSAFTLHRYPNIYLYTGGIQISSDGFPKMHVAKISATNLDIVDSTTIDAGGLESGAYAAIYVNASKQIVVGGYVKTEKGIEWLLALLTEDLKPVKIVKPGFPGSITGLAADQDGNVYAIDNKRIAKISPDGRVVSTLNLSNPVKVYATQDKSSPLAPYILTITENALHLIPRDDFSKIVTLKLVKENQLLVPYTGPVDSVNDSLYFALTRLEPDGKLNWYVTKITIEPKKIRFARAS